jgi:hypothetical protein
LEVKRRFLVAILGALLFGTISVAKTYSFSLEQPFNVSVPIGSRLGGTMTLRVLTKERQLEVRVGSAVQRLSLETLDLNAPRGSVLVDDFNFDGVNDIAVPTGIGYGGVNYFHAIYARSRSNAQFERLKFPGGSAPELCNPIIQASRRTIETSCKSGPAWYVEDFAFDEGGKPYLRLQAEMILLNGFASGDEISFQVRTFNQNGKTLTSSLRDEPRAVTAPLRYIPTLRVHLHTAPNAAFRTKRYIVRGDAVRLLEVRDVDGVQWLRVAYQSRALGRVVAWLNIA